MKKPDNSNLNPVFKELFDGFFIQQERQAEEEKKAATKEKK